MDTADAASDHSVMATPMRNTHRCAGHLRVCQSVIVAGSETVLRERRGMR